MEVDQKLFEVSYKLVQLMDKGADATLPNEISDVVKLHSKLAAGSDRIPEPGADMAPDAATIGDMYIRINNKLGLPFGEDIMKSVGSGVATNVASYLPFSGVANALRFIPLKKVLRAYLYTATLASGYIYLKTLCDLAEKNNGSINAADLQAGINEVMKNKSEIMDFVDSAKKTYKR